ncbi:MAG: AarF/UbiB family protein, partial [Candidatus Hydrogenedentes bacterium]|nr:AarF/UbiB family protein [Candidatus Hydrogenedentota bacterium]
PAKVLRGLHLMKAQSGEPETQGRRLRAALTELGPTAVKFGQILSTRPDFVGPEIAKDLGQLQDRVQAVEFETIKPVLEEELGAPVADLFFEFNEEAVASASLSQVYSAITRTGKRVAVKVQRPGVRRIIDADLALMRSIAELVAEHVSDIAWMDPVGMVDVFARSVKRELDFGIEARIIQRFQKNYEGDPHVFVPRVYAELSSDRVLTMDWVDGVRVDDIPEYGRFRSNPHTVAVTGAETLCKQVFEHRFFHADPHPGNIMLVGENRIAFLDYGMVGSLEESDTMAMADVLRAIFRHDADAAVQTMLQFTTSGDVDNYGALVHEVADYIAFDAEAIIASHEVGKAIDRLTAILGKYKLQLAPRVSLLLKALVTVESTGRALDPQIDMVPIIQPYVKRIVTQRFSPAQLAREARKNMVLFMRLGREMPTDVSNLMRMLRRGKLKIQLNHQGLGHLAAAIDRASNRVTVGLVTGSIIVGSSLLLAADIGARTLGLGGFIFAGLLGITLVISILRSRDF